MRISDWSSDVCSSDLQFVTIERLGTARLPRFFALKGRVDAALARLRWLPENLTDRLLFALGKLWPDHLPPRLRAWRDRFAHHLLLRVSEDEAGEMRALLDRWRGEANDYFDCTEIEEIGRAHVCKPVTNS